MHYQNQQRKKVKNQVPGPPKIRPNSAGLFYSILFDPLAYGSVKPLLSCQPRVTVTSCFAYTLIRDFESIDHLCINPIQWIGLIHK